MTKFNPSKKVTREIPAQGQASSIQHPPPLRVPGGDQLLCAKQLADELHRSVGYVYAMKRDGFPMPAGLATVNQALAWLTDKPSFRKNKRR